MVVVVGAIDPNVLVGLLLVAPKMVFDWLLFPNKEFVEGWVKRDPCCG